MAQAICSRQKRNRSRRRHPTVGFFSRIAIVILGCQSVTAQNPRANNLLAQGLRLADLYNWADAAPAFTEAERLFRMARATNGMDFTRDLAASDPISSVNSKRYRQFP